MKVGANICITTELAETVGVIAKRHRDCAIQIEWPEQLTETEWLVTATDGVNDHVYLARDDSRLNYIEASNELLVSLAYPHPAIAAQA